MGRGINDIMKLSFVIPCYRSEHTIRDVVNEVRAAICPEDDYEIIMISDHSPDNVFEVIKDLCREDPKLKGAQLSRNFGQHCALMAAYSMCTGDIIVTIDDDGQIPVDETYSLVNKINEGYDVVYGYYRNKKDSFFRKIGSKVNNKMAESMIGKPKNLIVTSFFAAKKYIIDEMLNYKNAYPYIWGLVFRTTQNIGNVPVTHRKREDGKSGYTLTKLISLWMNGFTAFSIKPLRVASILGILTAFIGFGFGIFTIINKIINPEIAVGYSSLMAVLLFIGGMLMIMLGLIGEYIGRIYISINNSPQYVISETVNVSRN